MTIACLQGRERWRGIDAIVDKRGDEDTSPAAPVQLLEEVSYAYEVTAQKALAGLEPADLFTSTKDRAEGRLDAQRATGTLTVTAIFADDSEGHCDVEIR